MYHALNNMYYQNADGRLILTHDKFIGGVIVFDLGDKETFEIAQKWVIELKSFAGDGIPLMIACNKCDLPERVVEEKDIAK